MRSIRTVNQELTYLLYNYNHLRIKTTPYLEEKKKLEKEKAKLLRLDAHEYAEIERKEKKQEKSKLQGKFSVDPNEAKKKETREISGEDVNIGY